MSGKHVALVVEDEPEMYEELRELLGSIGHDLVHAASQKEALALLEKGGFCYVLLDLQIKVEPDSIRPRVEAGHALLEQIRKRHPQRNREDYHCLPVLMMSGHAKEHHNVVKAFQAGANDFLTKPFGENVPSIDEKIRAALRRSGRDEHTRCATVLREAERAPDVKTGASRATLEITGRTVQKRTEVLVDGKPALLTNSSFITLMHLVAGRVHAKDGWVPKSELGAKDDQGWKGISRLRDELVPFLPAGVTPADNDKAKSYRLHPAIELGSIDGKTLDEHWDARVRKLAASLRTARA